MTIDDVAYDPTFRNMLMKLSRLALDCVEKHDAVNFAIGLGDHAVMTLGVHVPASVERAREIVLATVVEAYAEGFYLHGHVGPEENTPRGRARVIAFSITPAPETLAAA